MIMVIIITTLFYVCAWFCMLLALCSVPISLFCFAFQHVVPATRQDLDLHIITPTFTMGCWMLMKAARHLLQHINHQVSPCTIPQN